MTIDKPADRSWSRFWREVNITPFCWTWRRPSRNKLGPRFKYNGNDIKIGRMSYYLCNGRWPDGGAFRRCANPMCVKPDHLDDVRQADMGKTLSGMGRLRNRHRKKRKRCRRGHILDGDNVGTTMGRLGPQRYCRLCVNANHRARYARLKAEGVPRKLR